MKNLPEGIKTFNMRIDKELLLFLKQNAAQQYCSMTDLVVNLISDYKKRVEKKASKTDNNQSD